MTCIQAVFSSGGGGGGAVWEELCNVTTNGASSVSSGTITAKEFLHIQCTGVNSQTASLIPNFKMTFNNDTGSNYASIERNNNAGSGYSDRTSGSEVLVEVGYAETDAIYFESWCYNNADYDKMGFVSTNNNVTAGAGTAPDMQTMNYKWANTDDQITEIDIVNDKGNMDWRMVVLGHD